MLVAIETGGKQYIVTPGQKLKIEKLNAAQDETVIFDKVLLVSENDDATIGTPYISGATVEAKVLTQARTKKIIVFKYHNKTRHRKKRGHRQHFTEVEIQKIIPS